jgi:hypothetical protein
MASFGIQPNVFDAFISHHLDKAWAANKVASEAAAALDQRLGRSEARREAAEQRADRSEATAHEAVAHARELLARYEDTRQQAEALRASQAETQAWASSLQQQFDRLQADHHQTSLWARDLEQRVLAIQASTSWRLTRPLRVAGRAARSLARPGLLRRITLRMTSSERLRRLLIPLLLRFPGLRRRVSAFLAAVKEPQAAPMTPALAAVPEELRALPASVRGVLADLRRARGNTTRS